jgi:glutathione S-transferase
MKLYYLQGACSLASYIALLEAGQKFDGIAVDRSKKAADGKDFLTVSPKGYVPALVLEDGQVLTENVAVLLYAASLKPEAKLAPAPGTLAYFRVVEWLAYVNSEVHKNFSPLFRPDTPDEARATAKAALMRRLGLVEQTLATGGPFLTGADFTVADAYLYVTLSWSGRVGVDLQALPKVREYFERIRARPAVQQARREEGLEP